MYRICRLSARQDFSADTFVVTLEELERVKGQNKPLTLGELLSFDGADIDGIKPVWCEDSTGDENSGWILFDCKQKRTFNPYEKEWHVFGSEAEKYVGKAGCWRPWLRKPTDEERAAVPWEV